MTTLCLLQIRGIDHLFPRLGAGLMSKPPLLPPVRDLIQSRPTGEARDKAASCAPTCRSGALLKKKGELYPSRHFPSADAGPAMYVNKMINQRQVAKIRYKGRFPLSLTAPVFAVCECPAARFLPP